MGFSGNGYSTASTVITTQGDLRIGNSVGAAERLAIGSSGKVLESNGSTASWETITTADSTLSTQGDVLYQNASGLARLGQSTDGFVLTTKGASANPVWAAASGGATVEIVEVRTSADTSTTSLTFVDITGMSLTKPNITDGKCMLVCEGVIDNSTANQGTAFGLDDNGTTIAVTSCITTSGALEFPASISDVSDADGNTAKGVIKAHAGTAKIQYTSDVSEPKLSVIGVG